MMFTLQNVIILRISDFRRFFDWGEFWTQKDNFITFLKKDSDKKFFTDTIQEYYLIRKFHEWLINPSQELSRVKLETSEVKIETNEGELLSYPLGKIQSYVVEAKKQNALTNKTILGYTLLYLLLNANAQNSNIPIIFNGPSSNTISDFNRCWNDIVLEPATTVEFPLRRCVFINMNPKKDITIRSGKHTVILHKNDCVIGIFCKDKCFKLLPHLLSDTRTQTELKLRPNLADNTVTLEIYDPNKVEKIHNVVSIGMGSNGKPVYMCSDGQIYFDREYFILNHQYEYFIQDGDPSEWIALEINNDYLTLFAKNNILR